MEAINAIKKGCGVDYYRDLLRGEERLLDGKSYFINAYKKTPKDHTGSYTADVGAVCIYFNDINGNCKYLAIKEEKAIELAKKILKTYEVNV